MKRFSLTRLAALALALALVAPSSGLAQARDDFLPDAPLQPLDHIVTDPEPGGWVSDVFGDPGELAPLDTVADTLPPAATPDSLTPEIATPVADAGFDLPEGWAWHEFVISQPREDISYPVRIGFPDDFFKIDAEAMPDLAGEEGSVSFTETDLVQMGEAVMAGESDPYGTVVTLGLSRRPELPQVARDRGFSETSRGTLSLASGIVMTRLSGTVKQGNHTMVLEVFESQVPIDGTVYLALMIVAYGEREIDSLAQDVAQSLSITPSPEAPAEDDGPAEPLVLLDGALIIAELPEDWKLFNQRDGVVSFRSIGGYQGFIAIETGSRAVTAADLSQTFTGTPTERRGEIMGMPARLFEGRQAHDAFLQGYNMVAGSRVLALPDACLPGGVPVAITWAGSPGWFEQGAFDRFFEVARLDGLVPCPSRPVAPSASPPAASPPAAGTVAPQGDAPPAEPEHVAVPQPETPPTVAQGDTNAAALQAEILFWETVRDMDTQAAYEAYLSRWPEGQFAAIARFRLTAPSQPQPAETAHEAPPSDATAAAADCERLTGTTITDAFAARP